MPSESQQAGQELRRSRRILLLTVGSLCVVLGGIGIVIPVLPTTPFLLLAAACFLRSSQQFYNWLINNRILGFYIRNYLEGRGLPLRAKIVTISLLWGTILLSVFIFIQTAWVQILLVTIAIAVSIHVIRIKPRKHPKIVGTRELD